MAQKWVEARRDKGFFLDQELLQDRGVSAFRGTNLDEGQLGDFIAKARDGIIERGSYLIIERIDRFSRSEPLEIGGLLSKLVKDYGINLVILNPVEKVITWKEISNIDVVMLISMELQLANSQSKEKSYRIKKVWEHKRKDALEGKKIKHKLPSWLSYDDKTDSIKIVQEKAKAIRYIFKRTIDGIGQKALCKELVDKFPPITDEQTRSKIPNWNSSFIAVLLSDRRLLGEYQSYSFCLTDDEEDFNKTKQRKRLPSGPPIQNYYPRVISDEDFYKAQSAKSDRKRDRCDANSETVNLFRGLLFSKYSGSTYQINSTRGPKRKDGTKNIQKRLVEYDHARGIKNSCSWSIPYFEFENLILEALSEIDATSFAKKTTAVSQQRKEERQTKLIIEQQISKIERQLKEPKYFSITDSLLSNLVVLKDKLNDSEDSLAKLDTMESIEDGAIVEGLRNLPYLLNADKDRKDEKRKEARDIIPYVVKRIELVPLKAANREVKCLIFMSLQDGTYRLAFLRKMKNSLSRKPFKILQVDRNNKPINMVTKNGLVCFAKNYRGRSKQGGSIIFFGKNKVDKEVFGKLLKRIKQEISYMLKSCRFDKKWDPHLDLNLFFGILNGDGEKKTTS